MWRGVVLLCLAHGAWSLCTEATTPRMSDHLKVFPCGTPPTTGQVFHWDATSGVFTVAANRSLCITVGTEEEPNSHTPSVDVMPCQHGADSQQFSYDSSTKHIIHTKTKRCVDLDGADGRLELYGCHSAPTVAALRKQRVRGELSSGGSNQQWSISSSGVITTDTDGQCVSMCRDLQPGSLGTITGFTPSGGYQYNITAGDASVRVVFQREDIVRIWVAPNGDFSLPAGDGITVPQSPPTTKTTHTSTAQYYEMKTSSIVVRAYKSPLRFGLYDTKGTALFEETTPLNWNGNGTTQHLTRGKDEYYYGGGMQNGYFSHRGRIMLVEEGGGWKPGGRANPAPMFMSTLGYGVFRNTYAPGVYSFLENPTYVHKEPRFDAFYFYGPSLKQVLGGYTTITGRPFLPPLWGLTLGDSNCYEHPPKQNTTAVLAIADGYRKNNMPGGWLIPNDGYGCGYVQLPYVVKQLHSRGFYTALWTSTGLANATWEIGTAGTRGIKTDVAWVGRGYKFELDAVKTAASLILNNSNARPYTWTVCGWAGTHRYAVMWNGDNSGSWEYIQWQIPTVIGSGLSAQAHTSGDVDGIFGGSPATYTRDLQWKSFLTVSMTMSGWAHYAKQPWAYPEPYLTANRKILNLKMRLLPYQYTYARLANTTGVPPARGLVLEYPNDPKTWGNDTQYEFMSGEWFLVAPVYENSTTRDDIYLPTGVWVDYWTGARHHGPTTLNGYPVTLDIIPVFVRLGAIIPMWPEMLFVGDKPADPLTLDVYPGTTATHFTMYEDDGVSRHFQSGAFAEQRFDCQPTTTSTTITIGTPTGHYDGMPSARGYMAEIHQGTKPGHVTSAGTTLKEYTCSALSTATTGWCYQTQLGGVVSVKTGSRSTTTAFTVTVSA